MKTREEMSYEFCSQLHEQYAIADSGIFLEECPAYARSRTNNNCLFFIFRAHLFSEITTIT